MTDDKQNNPQHHGMNVSGLRRSATGFVLDRDDLADDPVVQFEDWFRYACDTVPMDPNAMSISTVDDQNRPSSRTVLLKYFDEAGFVFFTNFESKKAMQIEDNPNVALLFFWSDAARQIKIRGIGTKQRDFVTLTAREQVPGNKAEVQQQRSPTAIILGRLSRGSGRNGILARPS
jgi:pyridoxine/pyridoxamine 5'-phosphate oxidase